MRIPAVRNKFGLPAREAKAVATAAAEANNPLNAKPPSDSWSIKGWWQGVKDKRARDQALRIGESVGRNDYENFIKAGQGKVPRTFDYNPKAKSKAIQN